MYCMTQIFKYSTSYNIASMKKQNKILRKTKINLVGYEMIEKEVNQSGNSGRVYVPIQWIGKKVKVILIEK